MSFGVFVRLQTVSTQTPIAEVFAYGDADKPDAKLIPGTPQGRLTQRCHIIAWDLMSRNFAIRYLGKPLAQIAHTFNYTGPNEIGPMLSFVEEAIASQYKAINKDLTLYYNGPARANMSAGASYRAAKEQCEKIYSNWKTWSLSNGNLGDQKRIEILATNIRESQWKMFIHGFDNPPAKLFDANQIKQYQLQYIQIYQDVVTGHNPDLYYQYMSGIDTFDFLTKAQFCLSTGTIPT